MEGVDFAFSNPSPAGLAAAGKRFAMRYVGPGTSPKHLTVAEADALKRAGLSLVTLVEGATGDPKGGFPVGVSHARQAVAMLAARGFPTNRPMYFAIDYDVSSSSWAAAREYLRGAGSVIGANLVGIYGEYDAIAWASRDGVAAWFFQTYAWSGGKWYPGNNVEQYRNGVSLAGGTVDLCRSRTADFGQWGQGQNIAGKDTEMVIYQLPNGWVGCSNGTTRYAYATEADLKEAMAAFGITSVRKIAESQLGAYGIDVRTLDDPLTLTDEQVKALGLVIIDAVPSAAEVADAVVDEEADRLKD
jgi:hypothetical protein